jgi:hypothetical protein
MEWNEIVVAAADTIFDYKAIQLLPSQNDMSCKQTKWQTDYLQQRIPYY